MIGISPARIDNLTRPAQKYLGHDRHCQVKSDRSKSRIDILPRSLYVIRCYDKWGGYSPSGGRWVELFPPLPDWRIYFKLFTQTGQQFYSHICHRDRRRYTDTAIVSPLQWRPLRYVAPQRRNSHTLCNHLPAET